VTSWSLQTVGRSTEYQAPLLLARTPTASDSPAPEPTARDAAAHSPSREQVTPITLVGVPPSLATAAGVTAATLQGATPVYSADEDEKLSRSLLGRMLSFSCLFG